MASFQACKKFQEMNNGNYVVLLGKGTNENTLKNAMFPNGISSLHSILLNLV